MSEVSIWVMPALDAVVIALLAAVLWRLRRDPAAAWDAREHRLADAFERLRMLAAQSEGVARDLDGALDAHQQRLRVLLDEATKTVGRVVAAADPRRDEGPVYDDEPERDERAAIARVRRLAATAMTIEEIARRVDMPPAEVRVLVGLHGERAAAARAAATGRA